ncbi:MAG: M28 family peptidase [Gemmatimonadaceae bacterium]
MVCASLLLLATLTACDTVERFRGGKTAFSGDSALAYARAQVAFGPRVPGTDAHRRAGDWIIAQMRARVDSVEVQSWTHVTGSGVSLPLRNVIARIRPDLPQRVLFLAHWDTRPTADNDRNLGARQRPIPGANDGASGVALLIALADALRKVPPAVGVDLLFVDGEDFGAFEAWEDTTKNKDVLIGSQYFARHLAPDYRPIFGVLFDMIGDAGLQIYQEGHSVAAAPEVVSRVWSTANDLGYAKYFIPEARGGITDDHLPLIRKGLRVINVIDIDYCSDGGVDCYGSERNLHHTHGDTIERISARSLQIVGDVALTLVTR